MLFRSAGALQISDGDGGSNTATTRWNDQIFTTNDAYSIPMKIYRDDRGNLNVRNAGMAKLASDPTVSIGSAGEFSYLYAFDYSYEYR